MPRLFIVDHHQMMVAGAELLLEEQPDFEVVGTSTDATNAADAIIAAAPDVTIMVAELKPQIVDLAGTLKAQGDEARALLYTPFPVKASADQLEEIGFRWAVLQDQTIGRLATAIRRAAVGIADVSPRALLGAPDRVLPPLTDREREVVILLSWGHDTNAIAERLQLSKHTIRNHLRRVMAKYDTSTQAETVAAAIRGGAID